MVVFWTNLITLNEQQILTSYGMNQGRGMAAVVGALAYASVSRTAFSLSGVADIEEGDFDPVEFGRRCEPDPDRYRADWHRPGRPPRQRMMSAAISPFARNLRK